MGASSGIGGLGFNYVIVQDYAIAELYIDRGETAENKRIFDELQSRRPQIEAEFRGTLAWERLDGKRASRFKHVVERGDYRSPEQEWAQIHAEMVDAMIRLEKAIRPQLNLLQI